MSFLPVVLIVIALAGLPLFLVLSLLALYGYVSIDQVPILFFTEFSKLAKNSTLVAIPLFTLAGFILAESRASDRLVAVARVLLGWLPGGLAIIAVLTMALFTAFTGASGVTIVAMGGLLFPSLLRSGYKEKFSLGLLTASGSVGLLFPPSLPLIIYGVVSETPINKLFIGGIIPGMLMITGLVLYCIKHGLKLKVGQDSIETPVLPSVKAAIWEMLLPVVVVGGIYTGYFTATEAAIVTVLYLLIVECYITRDIHPIRDLPRILSESSILIGGILMILGAALALTNVLVDIEAPEIALGWIRSVVTSRFVFLLLLNLFLLVVGFMMDIF